MSFITLSGSRRDHPAGSVSAGAPSAGDLIEITLILKRNIEAPEEPPTTPLSRAEFVERHGASMASIHAVESFASAHHFSIVSVDRAARYIKLSGRLGAFAAVFGADLEMRRIGEKTFRCRRGELRVPQSIADHVVAIHGFDERPVANVLRRRMSRPSAPMSYSPIQLASIYNFPAGTGTKQTIALIELGGGFNSSDLSAYWSQLGLSNVSVTSVSLDGASNAPSGDPDSADGEVALDIEVAGAVAPGARIVVYFTSNTEQGFLDAINAAIHDSVRDTSVISISWGGPENNWTSQTLNAFNAAFHDAALLGISVCVAAGDSGSSDGEDDGYPHVDFPASSPWVLACGGTTLVAGSNGIQSETVWNDGAQGGATGGGVSSHFSRPKYQAHANVPAPVRTANKTGRGVPDVAAVADPATGYDVIVDGQAGVVGGTSAVAPFWAGLIAICNQQLGKNLGWFHNALYGTISQHHALHDITSGTNGAYHATTGWDACTGLGSPDGQAMLSVLKTSKD